MMFPAPVLPSYTVCRTSCPVCSGIPANRNSPGTSNYNRSTSRPYHSCRCSLFARTWDSNQPQSPLQGTFGAQVNFRLTPSSGRRRNKSSPPARRSLARAVRGARPAFRPPVPDFQSMISQIIQDSIAEDDVDMLTLSSLNIFTEKLPKSSTEDDVGVPTSSSPRGCAGVSTRNG